MSKLSRVINFLKNFLLFALGAIILLVPDESDYVVVCLILGIIITVRGIRKLFFYFSSARNMVCGERVLIDSIINIDLGFLSFLVLLANQMVAILYLVAVFVLLGVIDILRCIEIKKNGSKRWILKLIKGGLTIAVGIVCIVFAQNTKVVLIIFGCGAVILGIEGIIASFTKGAVEYVSEV